MKMVKKILLGLVATAAVIGFAGCKQVDDVNEAITGKNNDYAVDYENTRDENYRAYKSTSLKHAGALVKVTFEAPDENNFSKMGLIFDLHDSKTVADAKDFYIIGLAGTSKDKNDIKKCEKAILAGDKKVADEAFKNVQKTIDKALAKGLIKKNTASREKSRLNNKVKEMNK